MMKNAIEYSQLKNLVKRLEKKSKNNEVEKFFNNTSRILAKKLYKELWRNTPVVTGFLRHGWNVGLSSKYKNARLYPKDPVYFPKIYLDELGNIDKTKTKHYNVVNVDIEKIIPDKDGNKYTVHFNNPVSYAPFVEYGHKVTVGRRKPPSGLVKLFAKDQNGNDVYLQPYKEGHHYTYNSVENIKNKAPKIISKELYKFIRGK